MRARLLVPVLLGLVALIAPAAADARAKSSARKDGRVTVDAHIKRFAVQGRKIVARGVLTSRVEGPDASKAVRKRITFAVDAQRGRCHVLTLKLEDLQLDLLGLRVDLSQVNLLLYAVPRGQGSGVLGRLFCSLSRSTVRLRRGRGAAHAKEVVASLNSRVKKKPMRAFRASATLSPGDESASAAQQQPSCRVLNLILGPLDLNLLGLVVELYGPNRRAPVTLNITSFPGQGVLGDLFCNLSGGPR